MAVSNSLTKAQKTNTSVVEYESNGELVRLGPNMIRQYLVSGSGEVSDQEIMMFLSLCRYQHLNPFLREVYLVKYGNQPATMVVGKDVFLKRAMRNANFDGMQAGIIVQVIGTGEIIEREGTFYIKAEEQLVGGWARVYLKNYKQPLYESVSIDEYIGTKKTGEVNSMWSSKPATMIRKVALAHVLRETFPDELAGMYAQEEIAEVSDVVLDETPVQIQEEQPAVVDVAETYTEPSPASVLFS